MLRRTVTTLHQPAKTYRSPAPADREQAVEWGAWLCCSNPACRWNGARDYAASLNIARLGMAFLLTYHETKRYQAYRMTDASVNKLDIISEHSPHPFTTMALLAS